MMNMNTKALAGNGDHGSIHLYTFYPVTPYERLAVQLISKIHLGVIVVDDRLNVVEINQAAARLLGLEKSKMMYRSFRDAVIQLGLPKKYRDRLFSILHSRKEKRKLELDWCPDGEEPRCLLMRFHTFEDSESGLKGQILMIEDQTEMQLLRQQVQQNNRLATIGQIAAGTAHEIRNPLTAIRGFLQVIGHKMKENGQQKEHGYIDIMLREISRISSLVGEFLMLSKPRHLNVQSVNVTKVFNDILPIIKNEALLYNIDVMIKRQLTTIPMIEADGELLKQVFLNVSKNAIEAMKDGGLLTIRLKTNEKRKHVVVEIMDTGPGIPPHVLEKIYEPFFTTKENGTGLGLPICRQILREIDGEIKIESGPKGTKVKVYLPLIKT
ncbi:two-component system sensor histidine kinase NtrB [Thermoactinomyces intermedius]|jgi:two-component system, sporulation sensor kinase E|uniref:two-component system sensor histidine kinase NtrB n=2 Tax=Thermoactinomycetaceae TaxID=186824 RepID=UPI002868D4F0|nr:ATP-binding protein [Thermoactinomyces intermedius]